MITGNDKDVKPKSSEQLSIHDAANNNNNNTSDTRDVTEAAENLQWLEEGQQLNASRQMSRQMDLNGGPLVLRDCGKSKSPGFLSAVDLLDEFWPSNFSLDDVTNIIDTLERIPYMKDCLREHLAKAKSVLDFETVANPVLLSPEDERLLALIAEEDAREKFREKFLSHSKKEQLHSKKEQLHLKKEQLNQIRNDICRTLIAVQMKTHEVKNQLLYLAGMSQAESSMTHTSTAPASIDTHTSTAPASIDEPIPNKKQKNDERSELVELAEPRRIILSVESNCFDLEKVLPNLCKVSVDRAQARLGKVVKIIEDYLEDATFLPNNEPDYKKKIEAAMKNLRNEIRHATSEYRCGGERATPSEQITPLSMRTKKDEKYAPGPGANEKDGAQPWIQLLFQSIGACWEPSSSMAESPGKFSIQKEAPIPSTKLRPKRQMDFLLRKEGRWEAVIYDDILTIPVEAKTGCRKDKGPTTLQNEAIEQTLSHCAKHLFIGFNFASYGVPCHSTGIVVCMGFIQILQLRYENVGTPDAKLVLYKSARLPLMKACNFEKWAKAAGPRVPEFTVLMKDLYSPYGKNGMDQGGIPEGIQVLFNLMNQPGKRLYGLSVDVKGMDCKILDVPLGSGASSIVFRNWKNPSHVVKLSRYGIKRGIENETKILKLLTSHCSTVNDHLPQIVESDVIKDGMLQIRLGSVETALPAIELSPAGINASEYLMNKCNINTGLDLIFKGITSALTHMHERKIGHCDVTPKNIIVADYPKEPRAVLIDFSIAKTFDDPIVGFHGTTDYAHREIFMCHLTNKKAWKARQEHDKAGLGFTLAFFANKCIRPWDANHPRSVKKFTEADKEILKGAMKERLQKAREVIKTVGEPLEFNISELLHCDES